jgi:hypothetical protein
VSNRAHCLAIGVTTVPIALALTWPVWAETNQLTFCDREDEITAVTIYGDDAIPIINASSRTTAARLLWTSCVDKALRRSKRPVSSGTLPPCLSTRSVEAATPSNRPSNGGVHLAAR